MKSTNIPHLYIRNGNYYYRNNAVWKSLKTRCKKEAFKKVSHLLFGTTSAINDKPDITSTIPSTTKFIKSYLKENGHRWCVREYTRIENSLKFLPKGVITKDRAIALKKSILENKTVTTFNRYLKYFKANFIAAIIN